MTNLTRCPARACPTRWRIGPDRLCPYHHAEQLPIAVTALLSDPDVRPTRSLDAQSPDSDSLGERSDAQSRVGGAAPQERAPA